MTKKKSFLTLMTARLREGLRGVAVGRAHEARASGALGQEVQAQGRHSRGLDRWKGGDAELTGD
jgi:hypothetical protein